MGQKFFKFPYIIKPCTLPASRDMNQSWGDITQSGQRLQPESKPPHPIWQLTHCRANIADQCFNNLAERAQKIVKQLSV